MVIAYHVIIGMYGFWLPNDERGSWSQFVGSWELLRFGKATTVDTRRSRANFSFDLAKRDAARSVLKYPPVKLTGLQARAIGRGFSEYAEKAALQVYACSILPEHIHLVLGRHHVSVETQVNQLKGSATRRLEQEAIHPLSKYRLSSGRAPKVFSRGLWKVFIDDVEHLAKAVQYVRENPVKEGLSLQQWPFVRPFEE